MTSNRRLVSIGLLLTLCLTFAACKGDAYVGTWKPVETPGTDNDHMQIDSLNLNKDGTFSIKYKNSSRKEINGTYAKVGDKIELTVPGERRKVEGSISSDGRLGMTGGGPKAGEPVVYFAKS